MKWLGCALAILLTYAAHAYIDKSKIGWDQHVGAKLPLNLEFTDSRGQRVGSAIRSTAGPSHSHSFIYHVRSCARKSSQAFKKHSIMLT